MGEFAELGPLDVQLNDPLERGAQPFSPLDEFKSMEYLEEYASEILDLFTGLIIERSGLSIKEALRSATPATAEMMSPLYSKVDPSKVGGYRRSLAVGEEYAKKLLQQTNNPKAGDLTKQLVWGYPAHDFVIDYDEARRIGLPVERLEASQERVLLKTLLPILEYGASICALSEPTNSKKERARKRPVPISPASSPEKVRTGAAS